MQKIKDTFKNILISLTTFIILLLLIEGFFQLTFNPSTDTGCAEYSDTLTWTFKPNCGNLSNLGFRDYNYSISKDKDVYRILMIGDSVVEGHNVLMNETLGKQLELQLKEIGNYEVLNIARSGYTLEQEKELIKRYVSELNPDLIIMNYILNDPLNAKYHPLSYNSPRYSFKSKWIRPKVHLYSWLEKKTFFIKERFKGGKCDREYHKYLHCVYEDEIRSNFNEIGKISKKYEVPVLLFVNPTYSGLDYNNYKLSNIHAKVRSWSKQSGIDSYDILRTYTDYKTSEVGMCQGLNCDIWHPSAQGHRIISEYMYKILLEEEYVKQ